MAKVFPENVSDDQDEEDLDKWENPISVLLMSTKWQFDTYGSSTVNKSLVNNLRVVDPEGKKIKITCSVLEEEKNIKDHQREDAAKYKVKLKGAKQPRGAQNEPTIEWLDQNTATYYPDLCRDNLNFIIGHIPYLANGALNIRDYHLETEHKPKIIFMVHDFPRTTSGDIDEDFLLEWLSEADVVFSVGKEVEAKISSFIVSGHKPVHKLYIPAFPLELFDVHQSPVEGNQSNKVQGTEKFTRVTEFKKYFAISGLNTSITRTHLDFIGTVVEASCRHLEVELDSDSIVSQEKIEIAIKFGVDLDSLTAPVQAKKYILAFIHKLLLLDREIRTEILESGIVTLWQEVVSILENADRKLVDIDNGSLIFTLFCPTFSSTRGLYDDCWIKTMTVKMELLLKKIGVETQLRIHPLEGTALKPEPELLSRKQKKFQHMTGQSEGYGTRTTHRSSQSDLSYEIFPESKIAIVMEWLEQSPDTSAESDTSGHLTLPETMTVLDSAGSHLSTKFTVSGSVAIASTSLSVMYPGTNNPPLLLSRDCKYRSVIFMMEYLVAASKDDIQVWDLETSTSGVGYKFNEGKDWHLCVIDDRTVACVEEVPASDGLQKIHVLNTDSEQFTLSSTLRLKARQQVTDLCYVKTIDGTPCLLLSFPWDNLIQCVEMVGGKVRWQIHKQPFIPWSICTDGSTVFVVDPFQHRLHLVSLDDGSRITSINLYPFGIDLPSCVCLQEDHLYIGHLNEKETYCISKFAKPVTI